MKILGVNFKKHEDHYRAYFGTAYIGYKLNKEDLHCMWFYYSDCPTGSSCMHGKVLFSSREEGFINIFSKLIKRMREKFDNVENTYLTIKSNLEILNESVNNSEQLKSQLDIKDILE